MRPLEWFLLVVSAGAVLWPFVARSRTGGVAITLAAIGAAGLQAIVEGPRWQFYGLYILLLLMLALRVFEWRSKLTAASEVAVATLTLVVAAVLPVPELPAVDAEANFRVGTTSWTVLDGDRPEPYTDSREPRRFVAQAWYPTEADGPRSDWLADADAFSNAVAPVIGLPGFALGHLRYVTTAAITDAPIAAGPHPVVVYSHGWSGFRTAQTNYVEFLASRGYVVLALDHTYGAAATIFPNDELGNGDVIELSPDALPNRQVVGPVAHDAARELLEETFALDVAETLDQLTAGQGPDLLRSALVLDRVGLSGHSTGGGAMYRLCIEDSRCAAALGFDPWVQPIPTELLAQGLIAPVASIRSEDWQGNDNDSLLRQFHADSPADDGMFYLEGTLHADFTLQPFLTPVSDLIGSSGPADDTDVHEAVNFAALNFFDRHLRGSPGPPAWPTLLIRD